MKTVKNIGVKLDQEHLDMLLELQEKLASPLNEATISGVVKYALQQLHQQLCEGKEMK